MSGTIRNVTFKGDKSMNKNLVIYQQRNAAQKSLKLPIKAAETALKLLAFRVISVRN